MKMTLEKRILLFSFLILFLTIFIGSGMDIMALRRDQVNALNLRSKGLAAALKSNIEKVLNLGVELKDTTGVSEKCREIIEGNPDIAYCVVSDLSGKVLFASDARFMTFPAQPHKKGEADGDEPQVVYKRRVSIPAKGGAQSYYDNALLVLSPYGKPIARTHVGFSEQVVYDKMKGMLFKTLFLLGISLVISFSLIMLFMKKYVMTPISMLLKGVKQISEGAFDTQIGEVEVYEFNELARNVNIMSQFLKNRDAEIKKNYRDMERTFDELQESYRKLESLSTDLERSEELYKSLMEDRGHRRGRLDPHGEQDGRGVLRLRGEGTGGAPAHEDAPLAQHQQHP